jgi:2-oxoacid:acceptor oxidoreductase delta subunit (pyruvate/2-ketoisovalerate family)
MAKKSSGEKLKNLPPTTISSGSSEKNETGQWRYRKPVIDFEKCNRCGLCWLYCPDNAVQQQKGAYVIRYKYCKGCGICAVECPARAISLENEER